MIYRVLMDGQTIYEEDGQIILLEPKLEQEINTAGSFEFTMPASHILYTLPTLLTHEVDVYEGDNLIFFGRPTEIEIDAEVQKRVYCEGALAYFSDSIIPPFEVDAFDRRDLLEYFVERHNVQVPANRQFTVGNVTMDTKLIFRKTEEYKTTLECMNELMLNAEGGYLMVRKENGVRYIDWYETLTSINTQPVRFSLNLISLSQKVTADFFTVIIPLGADDLTIATVNGGRVYLESDEYVAQYGRITGVVKFDDISDPSTLMAYAMQYLEDQRYGNATINVIAAELHYINNEYTPFLIGEKVHVTSYPHGIDAVFPIVKLTLDLDKADKEIEIGTLDRRTLTELIKDDEGKMVSGKSIEIDETPTYGSGNAVSSAGVFAALGPLRFSVNNDGTVTVREVSSEDEG